MEKMVTDKQVVKTQTQTLIHMKVVYLCLVYTKTVDSVFRAL